MDKFNKTLASLNNINSPITKETLKRAVFSVYDSLNDEDEDHSSLVSFLDDFSSFYKEESGKSSENYWSIRERFKAIDWTGYVKNASTRATLKAMVNSAIDSLRDPWEDHEMVYNSLRDICGLYPTINETAIPQPEAAVPISRRQYRDLNFNERRDLYNRYINREKGVTRKEFVEASGLSSLYALGKIVREYNRNKIVSPSGFSSGADDLSVAMAPSS